MRRRPAWHGIVVAAAVLAASGAAAQAVSPPTSVFGQFGTVRGTHSASIGVTWDWAPSWTLGAGRVGGYWETSAAVWSYKSLGGDRSELLQWAFKPVFRYRSDNGASPWFYEAGVGLTATSSVYYTERKRFSSVFNFGDHLAVGRSFGENGSHEVALRVEHFSNGGIKQPNPGETFLQLRYSYRFR